ncbi:hypothetical protein M5E06_20820 [Azospirillum sp. A1-3]|uniref:hypothetical protein n=1 Tax=Azospirillum sp. A1-3 TaxID=185874 RepID=UPI0020776FBF|nr:hypothetical protein [Azospirillum sp. A1-3]MCM8736574.1 hypothetical protein [Azospirillum sp. A1-3]
MELHQTYEVLADAGALRSLAELDQWLGQRPGYSKRCKPRRASLAALLRLAARLDELGSAARVVPALARVRMALAAEITNRVATDAR